LKELAAQTGAEFADDFALRGLDAIHLPAAGSAQGKSSHPINKGMSV
jgi:hypothetical protein